jgi:CBS domain-containing protein
MICPNCGFDNVPGNETCSHCHQALSALDLPTPQNQIERSLMEDRVKAILRRDPITISPKATIGDAIQLMLKENLGALLVVDDQENLLGIFSERDLLKKVVGIHEDLKEIYVQDFMTPNPETVAPKDPLNYALHKMDIGGYRHVPATDGRKPIGMVSVRDMLRHMTNMCQK